MSPSRGPRTKPSSSARAASAASSRRAAPLFHLAEQQPLQDLGRPRAAVGMDAEQAVDAFVDAALLAAAVHIESAPRLASQPSFFHEDVDAGPRSPPTVGTYPLP